MQFIIFFFPLFAWAFLSLLRINKSNAEMLFLFLIMAVLFLRLSFFDFSSVPDVEYYNDAFYRLDKESLRSFYILSPYNFEYGYAVYTKLLTFVSDNPRSLYVARALFTIFVLSYIFRRYSKNVFLSGVVFFLFSGDLTQSVFVIRQYLAIMIFWLAIPSILNKKLFPFLIITTCSYLFHRTAIVYYPLYFIYNYSDFHRWGKFRFLVSVLLVGFYSSYFMYEFSSQFDIYTSYYNNDREDGKGSAGMALRSLVVLLPFFLYYKEVFKDKVGKFLFITSVISFVLSVGMIGVTTGSRLFPCYNYFSCLALPWVYEKMSSNRKGVLLVLLLAIFIFLYIRSLSDAIEIAFMWE